MTLEEALTEICQHLAAVHNALVDVINALAPTAEEEGDN